MRKTLFMLLILCVVIATPALAGRITSTTITHLEQVYQVCSATSDCLCFEGYDIDPEIGGIPVITAAPGILCILPQDPGETPWANFVGAAQEEIPVPYTIKNVSFTKVCPQYVQCGDVFPAHTVTQQGTPNIRLWWPLMYELPSCQFTLSILYGTPVLYDDDGVGPNPPAWVHQEQWIWHVDADLPHLSLLLDLFHELPFGLDEVPLISDEPLYFALKAKIDAAIAAFDGGAGDLAATAAILADFELEVMDACISVSPPFPNPTGPTTGIANSLENPACCKLLIDVEYIFQTTGIGQPAK